MKINKIREEDLMTKNCGISIDHIPYCVYGARGEIDDALQQFGSIVKKVEESK